MNTKRFRVWIEDTKKMVPWSEAWHMPCCIPSGTLSGQTEDIWLPILSVALLSPPDKMVAEQWTGLTDSTGREIYEGDVVAVSGEPNMVVRWSPDLGRWSLTVNMTMDPDDLSGSVDSIWVFVDKAVVIGNIHQNRDLLP